MTNFSFVLKTKVQLTTTPEQDMSHYCQFLHNCDFIILSLKVRKNHDKGCFAKKIYTVNKAVFSRCNWKILHLAHFVFKISGCDGCVKYPVWSRG